MAKKRKPGTSSPQLDAFKALLEAADERAFEDMAAALFSRLLGGVGVYVAKTGSQFGGDAGTSALRGRHLRIECKRYREATRLDPRDLAGEVTEAAVRDDLLEAWVLMSTKQVSETERNLAQDAGERLGVPIIVIDWTPRPSGLCALVALCATWPDQVELHIGRAAADAARALIPQSGSTVDHLRLDLAPWFIGFDTLRQTSRRHFQRTWEDSAESKAALNQDAAGGRAGVHLVERDGPLAQLSEWWQRATPPQTPAVVLGSEGVGKTWVALDWVHRHLDQTPIVIIVGASEFVGDQWTTSLGVAELIVRRLRAMTKSTRTEEFWRARVQRLLERPMSEGPVFLLVVDGLNQQPHVDWKGLASALQGEQFAANVRLLVTARTHYFEADLKRLRGLEARPAKIEVGPYNDKEFTTLLALHNMAGAPMHSELLDLARMPRLFPLVLRLRNNAALQSDATVPRLLFEYGRDVLQMRRQSSLTDDDWSHWLTARAREHRDRLVARQDGDHARTVEELAHTVAGPQRSAQDIARRLSDVIDGGFFRTIKSPAGNRHVLNSRHATLGLALALLEELTLSQATTFSGMQSALNGWFEPVAAIDQLVDVVVAALAVLSATPESDGELMADALLTEWMNAQNPAAGFLQDLDVFGNAFPRSMVTVVEQSVLQSRSAAFNHAIQALRKLDRKRVGDWQVVVQRMLRWCGRINLPKPEDVADPNHYASRHRTDLLIRVGSVEPGAMTVLGESLELGYSHAGDPASAIPGILEGHDLTSFMAVFRRAAVREAAQVDFRGDCWAGLKWLVQLAGQDEAKTRAAVAALADEVLVLVPEPGVHARLRNRAAALLLRMTGDLPLEERARSVDEQFGNGWRYEQEYLQDPATSWFPLERRHVQHVMARGDLHAGRRLERLGPFPGGHPNSPTDGHPKLRHLS